MKSKARHHKNEEDAEIIVNRVEKVIKMIAFMFSKSGQLTLGSDRT